MICMLGVNDCSLLQSDHHREELGSRARGLRAVAAPGRSDGTFLKQDGWSHEPTQEIKLHRTEYIHIHTM